MRPLIAADLFAAIVSHHRRSGHRFIKIDLSAVTFFDSTALRAIVAAHNELLAQRGQLTLSRVSHRVIRILQLTGLDRALRVVSSPADAQDRPAGPDATTGAREPIRR